MHIRFKVVILILTLKLVKQHAKSQAEITQEKFCNIFTADTLWFLGFLEFLGLPLFAKMLTV